MIELLSVTVAAIGKVPGAVGVPESVPSAARLNPAGNPEPAHVYGGVPPLAASLVEYVLPTVPPGNVVVETVSGAMVTV